MYIPGTSDNEQLIGTDGNDHLDGGAGEDTLQGGLGDDYYIVNSIDDKVSELANQGFDSVVASVNYTLSDNVENLFLAGNATVGTGNSADNFLVGNQNLASTLYGKDGNDVIMGGAGKDFLYGDAGNDYLNGGAGADYMAGGAGNDYYVVDTADSFTLMSVPWGQMVQGPQGWIMMPTTILTTMFIPGDQIVENAGEGVDSVLSSVNYTLSNNVENLFLTGNATVGTGNSGDNSMSANQSLASTLNGLNGNDYLYGGAGIDSLNGGLGNDYLNGGAGADSLVGATGNDYYVVDSGQDQVVETDGAGVDSVVASVDYTLSDNVENLFLTGNAILGHGNSSDNYLVANSTLHSWLSGDEGNDVIMGGAGNDVVSGDGGDYYLNGSAGNDSLYGGTGNDYITGGEGNDTLVGNSPTDGRLGNDILIGGAGRDAFNFYYSTYSGSFTAMDVAVIADFTNGEDRIQLNGFDGAIPGILAFASVTSDQEAATSDATIVYNSTNGSLFYNQDGVTDGFGSGGLFATLSSNPTLTVSDFTTYAY